MPRSRQKLALGICETVFHPVAIRSFRSVNSFCPFTGTRGTSPDDRPVEPSSSRKTRRLNHVTVLAPRIMGPRSERQAHSCSITSRHRTVKKSVGWFGLSIRILITSLLLIGLEAVQARGETPAPSVHWGSISFPDQYTTVTTGLTLARFTPTDGTGQRYDSTITNTIGFNLITLSWTQHWEGLWEGWSTNLTAGISPTSDEPSQFFQNEVVHQLRHLPPVPVQDPRKATDAMVDGSLTRWFPLMRPRVIFIGAGFSVGTIYQQGFFRAGLRRLPLTPTLYHGSWGDVGFRGSVLGRISYQEDGAVVRSIRQTSGLVQPSLAFGQYGTNKKGETIPIWEVEFALMWDSGIFVNEVGKSQRQFAWSVALSGGPIRLETWNDSMGNLATRDFGPTYGVSLTADVLRIWRYFE